MHTVRLSIALASVTLSLWIFSSAYAINISVQYTPGILFYPGIDGTAKAAINAAAADVSDAITTSLNAISTDVYSGTNASTTVTFDWSYNYNSPSTGGSTTITTPAILADSVTIFAGARSLLGNTLGVGGTSGVGLSPGASGFPNESPAAVNSVEAQSQVALSRGGGPVIGSLGGAFDFNGTVTNYSVDYGIAYGSLSLDNDSDNNGQPDTDSAALDSYWHWNHTTPVSAGKNDLYSVALHEILHAVGLGVSRSWDDLVAGTTWTGTEVQTLIGSGANLVTVDGGHITSGIMSTRISDGMPQEVVMDPTITQGSRKELTALDLAFLRDIGYETVTPQAFSPADYNRDGDVDGGDLATLNNWYGTNNPNGDADGDGDTDGADFLAWQQQYTGPLATSLAANVPEPSTAWLLLTGLLMISRRRA